MGATKDLRVVLRHEQWDLKDVCQLNGERKVITSVMNKEDWTTPSIPSMSLGSLNRVCISQHRKTTFYGVIRLVRSLYICYKLYFFIVLSLSQYIHQIMEDDPHHQE